VTRRQQSGLRSDTVLAWVIPVLTALVLVAACVLWLGAEVSGRRPSQPVAYFRAVISGRAPLPGPWGWTVTAVATVVLITAVWIVAQRITARYGCSHRADAVARFLAPRRDRMRLGPRAGRRKRRGCHREQPGGRGRRWDGSCRGGGLRAAGRKT
jgi:uncharacterized membrane protein